LITVLAYNIFLFSIYNLLLFIVFQWDDLLNIGKRESEDKLLSVLKTIGVNECCILVYTVRRIAVNQIATVMFNVLFV